jgi:hypothetical protein
MDSAGKTLYIHAGGPKTGSTRIQTFCSQQREKLLAQSSLSPDFEIIIAPGAIRPLSESAGRFSRRSRPFRKKAAENP